MKLHNRLWLPVEDVLFPEISDRFSLFRFGGKVKNVSTKESIDPKTSYEEIIHWSYCCIDKVNFTPLFLNF
jgi:hypothetical protein